MQKHLSSFALMFVTITTFAQSNISEYLKTHHYSFSLDKGFDQATSDTLKQKLSAYKLILQAEGGSHNLKMYTGLALMWIKFLNSNFGLTHFFFEGGPTGNILFNKYLQTGDTSYLHKPNHPFWRSLYTYNAGLPVNNKLKYFGVDFVRPTNYFRALKSILPGGNPPESISPSIDLIRNGSDDSKDCNYTININKQLKIALLKNKQKFIEYFGENYTVFERFILNRGTCKDEFKNRNNNMASNFLSHDEVFRQSIYYGELGEAHTILKYKTTAAIINNSPSFYDKVGVINLYCYNCSAPGGVSNWQLDKIEKDILNYFLPYCSTDFTLFDLTGNSELTRKYRAYGQFLIIAKNQN